MGWGDLFLAGQVGDRPGDLEQTVISPGAETQLLDVKHWPSSSALLASANAMVIGLRMLAPLLQWPAAKPHLSSAWILPCYAYIYIYY